MFCESSASGEVSFGNLRAVLHGMQPKKHQVDGHAHEVATVPRQDSTTRYGCGPQEVFRGPKSAGDPGGRITSGSSSSQQQSVRAWAGSLLDAVNRGSAPELLNVLAEIIRAESGNPATPCQGGQVNRAGDADELEVLQAIALQMRIDLHSMLMHIYQRLEASRSYLKVVRHLANGTSNLRIEQDGPRAETVDSQRPYSAAVVPWPARERSDTEPCVTERRETGTLVSDANFPPQS